MKVLMVGGGAVPIPPPGWGGIENVIWHQKTFLEKAGHTVNILNTRRFRLLHALRARPWRYDLVHLHDDARARLWIRLSERLAFKLAVTSQYAYAAFPEKWSRRYRRRTFPNMLSARYLITVSNEIAEVVRQHGYQGRVFVLPNGTECDDIRFAPEATKQAIVLGRVEERKKQAHIIGVLTGHPVECDIAGPRSRQMQGFRGNGTNVRYIGPWTRAQVRNHLTDYACLILLSDGEAHVIAVLEAMAAGLSLVLSPEASHNLDRERPWLHVVDRDGGDVVGSVERAIRENGKYRQQIRRYCAENFSWDVIGPRYIEIAEQILHDR